MLFFKKTWLNILMLSFFLTTAIADNKPHELCNSYINEDQQTIEIYFNQLAEYCQSLNEVEYAAAAAAAAAADDDDGGDV